VTVQGVFTVDGWRTAGSTTINGGQITADTIDCASLKTSTLISKTIYINTAGAGTEGIIQSTNYWPDVWGWKISGDGNAEFNNVKVRGTLYASTLETGNTLQVKGNIQSNNYVYNVSGWKLWGNGTSEFYYLSTVSGILATGDISGNKITSRTVFVLDANIASGSAPNGCIYFNGTNLIWKDRGGSNHTIV